MKEDMFAAMDTLAEAKRGYYQGEAEYDVVRAAAVKVIELRQAVEKKAYGRVKTKLSDLEIARLIR